MRAEIKVKLGGVSDAHIDGGASGNVATAADLFALVRAKEAGVMTLLHHNEGDARAVVLLEEDARLADCQQFVGEHLLELALGDTVAIEDNAMWLETSGAIELNQQLLDHVRQVLDDFLTVLLNTDGSRIATRVAIHRSHQRRNRWFLVVTGGWVSNVRAKENDGLAEDFGASVYDKKTNSDTFYLIGLIITYRMVGIKMLLMPPNLTLIFRHRFDRVCGEVLLTFLL